MNVEISSRENNAINLIHPYFFQLHVYTCIKCILFFGKKLITFLNFKFCNEAF